MPEDDPTLDAGWTFLYDHFLHTCLHGPACRITQCQAGKRMVEVCVLSGAVVRIWGVLQHVLERKEAVVSKAERGMRIVRVEYGAAVAQSTGDRGTYSKVQPLVSA